MVSMCTSDLVLGGHLAGKKQSARAADVLRSMNVWMGLHASDCELAVMGVASLTFIFATLFFVTHYRVLDFSSVLTLGGGVQCLGFLMLALRVRLADSVAGISAKTLQLYVLVYVCRLSSTMVKEGYIPLDKTGDWLYQLADVSTLGLVLLLLHRVSNRNAGSYQRDLDTMPIAPAIAASFLLALATYGDLNNSWFFDYVWMVSVNLDTVAMLPQLFVLTKRGGQVEALTSHFVAAVFASRLCVFSFWFYGYPELAPANDGFNYCGYMIIVAHLIQLMVSGDFMYYYVSALYHKVTMSLPEIDV